MSNLKQELDNELSQLVRKYEDRGLSPSKIGDSLSWHLELAESRQNETQRVSHHADD